MKALIYTEYGNVDVVRLEELAKPVLEDYKVLVRVHAAAVNDWELGIIAGRPYFMRFFIGWLKPIAKVQRLGCDVAGRIEAVGKEVGDFNVGDEVYGDLCEVGLGSFAEYVCVPTQALKLKPPGMSFEQAAALPQAAMLAKQGLHDIAPLQDKQKILINGAGGGVGTLGVQIAKLKDVEVTGVDCTEKLEMMRSIGFDQVIDYTQSDFVKGGETYDLILDNKMSRSPFSYAKALKPGGAYIATGGSMARIFQLLCVGWWISISQRKLMRVLVLKANKDLDFISELFESEKLKPVIDRTYTLAEGAEALGYYVTAKHKGKIVITVD